LSGITQDGIWASVFWKRGFFCARCLPPLFSKPGARVFFFRRVPAALHFLARLTLRSPDIAHLFFQVPSPSPATSVPSFGHCQPGSELAPSFLFPFRTCLSLRSPRMRVFLFSFPQWGCLNPYPSIAFFSFIAPFYFRFLRRSPKALSLPFPRFPNDPLIQVGFRADSSVPMFQVFAPPRYSDSPCRGSFFFKETPKPPLPWSTWSSFSLPSLWRQRPPPSPFPLSPLTEFPARLRARFIDFFPRLGESSSTLSRQWSGCLLV